MLLSSTDGRSGGTCSVGRVREFSSPATYVVPAAGSLTDDLIVNVSVSTLVLPPAPAKPGAPGQNTVAMNSRGTR